MRASNGRVSESGDVKNRRPLKTRGRAWARWLTGVLAATPLTPNGISLLGMLFAFSGFAAYLWAHFHGQALGFLAAAFCIQARLLCNMMDGLVAVEAGKSAPTGILFNEAPDRLEDAFLLLGGGIASGVLPWGAHLGWMCVALALGTAYVRVLGGSLGLEQDFCGPMAKQHRMFFLTLGSLGAFLETLLGWPRWSLAAVLLLIAFGSFLTLVRRLVRIAAQLKARA